MSACCGGGGLDRATLARRYGRTTSRHRLPCGCFQGACNCWADSRHYGRDVPRVREASSCFVSACEEVRADGVWLVAMAARYGIWSSSITESGRTFRERIEFGAFDDALRAPDLNVSINVGHDEGLTLARYRGPRNSPGSRIWADRVGLHFEVRINEESELAQETLHLVRSGRYAGTSFKFEVGEDRWKETSAGLIRHILRIERLHDVCFARVGAYSVGLPEPKAA